MGRAIANPDDMMMIYDQTERNVGTYIREIVESNLRLCRQQQLDVYLRAVRRLT